MPYSVTSVLFDPFVDSYTFSPTVLHMYLRVNGQGLVGGYAWKNAVLRIQMFAVGAGQGLIAGRISPRRWRDSATG
jgi:hypothetical protein